MEKRCPRCGRELPLTEFHKGAGYCKECSRSAIAEWRKANADRLKAKRAAEYRALTPEQRAKISADNRARYANNPASVRAKQVLAKYGLTPDQYDQMVADQGNRCAICARECVTGRRLAVDHSHVTGLVRGLLCISCNNGLGRFGDDPSLLRAAADYVESYATSDTATIDRNG